jgi:outer membrane protein OmpA-like peptidoglycan-associated protein/opacity protein-like surface antigen
MEGELMKGKTLMLAAVMALIVLCPVMAQLDAGKFDIGFYGSAKKLVGGNRDVDIVSPMLGIKLGYTVDPALTFTLNGGTGVTYPRDAKKSGLSRYISQFPNTPFKTSLIPVTFNFKGNFRPESRLNPYLTGGLGVLLWNLKSDDVSIFGDKKNALADLGVGVEWFLADFFGLDLSLHYQHILNHELDMSGYGDEQSGMIDARVGVNFYFGGNRDSDGDGILNRMDKCPKVAEDIDGFQDEDGCPDLDNDGDGIPDLKDKCPNQAEDIDGYQDEDGCPDLDNDGDGIFDAKDKCPNQAEDIDGFQDEDGCPDLDNDGDGIPDLRDKCPNQPETVNGFEDEDGCPDRKPEVVIQKDAPIVLEGVTFETASDKLTAGAKSELDKVVRTLGDYPQMMLEVRGYTDSQGGRLANVKLSQRRADAVKAFLAGRGVEAKRIQAKGFGPDNPVAPNTDAAGRAKNRRIEFIRAD